jgi:hypothetical protein
MTPRIIDFDFDFPFFCCKSITIQTTIGDANMEVNHGSVWGANG